MNRLPKLLVAATGAHQILPRLFPSAPAHARARMRIFGPPMTPAPTEEGEATVGAGQTPEGEVAPATEPTSSERVDAVELTTPRPPGSPLPVEYAFWWMAHPCHVEEFTDEHLAQLVDEWQVAS